LKRNNDQYFSEFNYLHIKINLQLQEVQKALGRIKMSAEVPSKTMAELSGGS
jgi:hypothetical protein